LVLSHDALVAAAANNHVPVLRLIVQSNRTVRRDFTDALGKAIEGGHLDAIESLIEAGDDWSIEDALERAVATIGADILRLILERRTLSDAILAGILDEATKVNRCEILELKVPSGGDTR
jgi:hypothetical protein